MIAVKKAGWQEASDLQNMDTCNAFARANRYVSLDGRRQDTAHMYLHPLLNDGKHPNLHVLVESQAVRVLMEGKKAVGVVYRPNPRFQSDTAERTVRAKRMVIVSCGSLTTPTVLERSGIGSPDVLKKAGVELVVDNPGVGRGYEDHHLLANGYYTNLEYGETIDHLARGEVDVPELFKNNDPFLSYNAQDASGKIRPTEEEVAALGPEFQKAWNEHFRDKKDKPLCLMAMVNG